MTVFLNQREFQSYVLQFISSEQYKDILKNMINGDDEKFQQGFIQGLCWGSLLTSQIHHYYADIESEETSVKTQQNIKDNGVENDTNSQTGAGTEDSSGKTP